MINVLLLGDSIRGNYQKDVIKRLGADYDVYAPADNCRFSMYTLCNITKDWLHEFPAPDIVHWNNGIWDIRRMFPEDGCFTPIDEYIRNMERILRQLKKTNAKIIFATTTPVLKKEPNEFGSIILNEDIEFYNKKIIEHLANNVDAINDLYNLALPKLNEYLCDDKIHLNNTGKAVLGQAVADIIKRIAKQTAGIN